MEGIAAGLSAAGVPTTLDDIIGWNAYMEITGYWWPTVASQYVNDAPNGNRKSHCSAFIATGSATTDGRIVIGHESFTEFWNGQFMNVILDITPTDGHRIVMQTSPGWVASMTDFWVTGGGMVVVETTMVGYEGYDTSKVPEYVRARNACQFATSIDEWVKLMDTEDNGGYANMWLIGDIKTGEIADYEQGLIYQDLKKKTDGWFFGDNAPNDPRIRNVESSDTGYNDVRQQTGARRVRWPQLLAQYEGRIDERDRADDARGHLRPLPRLHQSLVTHHLLPLRRRPDVLRQRPERGLECPVLPGRVGRREGDDGRGGGRDDDVGDLRPRRRRPIRCRGVSAAAPAVELAGGLSGEPPVAAVDGIPRRITSA